jgi:Serine dehydrogenase proteinase
MIPPSRPRCALTVAVSRLQTLLEMPVWLLVQDGRSGDTWNDIGERVSRAFYSARRSGLLPTAKIALVIDSNGGHAEDAFEIAKVLQRHCGGFIAVVPRHAKSAATLLALGADEIVMGPFGEFGPLDVQIVDPEREECISGLDEVQALERLHAFAMSALDQTMLTLCARTSRKVVTMLPHAIRLITQMARPLFDHIDVVRYTQMARSLKVGEEYAWRLLSRRLGKAEATRIARNLVENYPIHSFVIDVDEMRAIGLEPTEWEGEQNLLVDSIAQHVSGLTAIGPLVPQGSEQ